MTDWEKEYASRLGSVEQALALVKSGDIIAASGVVAEPREFFGRLHEVAINLEDVTVVKSRSHVYPFMQDPTMRGHVFTLSHLFSEPLRSSHALGLSAYLPSDLSTFGRFRTEVAPNNIFVAAVTPMDEAGNFQIPYCQMFEREMLACAKTVILEVNPNFRRIRGGVEINVKQADVIYTAPKTLPLLPSTAPSEVELQIGSNIASLIHDGDTIQLGIGHLPDAVAVKLSEKNDLGLHSEMFTPAMAELVKKGVITGKYKTVDPGEHLAAFALGDMALYDALSDISAFRIAPCSYTNDPFVIARQDNMKSINTCIEIDLLGQVCSETIGPEQYSGTGGAADFALGALRSRGGRGIMAFTSTAKHGTLSKIKPALTYGAAVTVPRNYVDTVITEYGVAELKGRSVPERAEALIAIAHPKFRDELRDEAKRLGYIF